MMNAIATIAIMAATLTGPLPDGAVTSNDLSAPGERSTPQIAQTDQEVRPVPVQTPANPKHRIAAFWIILPN